MLQSYCPSHQRNKSDFTSYLPPFSYALGVQRLNTIWLVSYGIAVWLSCCCDEAKVMGKNVGKSWQAVYGVPAGKGWMFSVGREGSLFGFGLAASEVQVQQVFTSIQWSSFVTSAA